MVFVAGQILTAADLNSALNAAARHGVHMDIVQAFTTDATLTALGSAASWTESGDTDGFGTTGATVSPITIPSGMDGVYVITATGVFSVGCTGRSFLEIFGSPGLLSRSSLATSEDSISTATVRVLAAGSTIGVRHFFTKGNATSRTCTLGLDLWRVSP